jgi:hypothetical protein
MLDVWTYTKHLVHVAMRGLVLALLLFPVTCLLAQTNRIQLSAHKSEPILWDDNGDVIRFQFSFNELQVVDVQVDEGAFSDLILSKGHYIGEPGTPKLPVLNTLIEIPFGAELAVIVHDYTTREIHLPDYGIDKPLMPVQPSRLKTIEPEEKTFFYQQEYYNKSGYIEHAIASIEVLGVLRGARLARLTIAPVQYNPADSTIKVYNDIDVEVQFKNADHPLTSYVKASTYSPHFDLVYQQALNSPGSDPASKAVTQSPQTPIKMLIIAHPDFRETLKPFITWQIQRGFKVIDAYTNAIGGTPAAIKSFIQMQYQQATPSDPAPTYLVLVGDILKLPASGMGTSTNEVTDLYYASVDGDFLPDMYYGRLSARNPTELKNQIDKILYYQKYQFDDPAFLNDATFIAGEDSFWNTQILQPTVKYATQNYYNTSNGFTRINEFLTNYTGSYNQQNISVGLINFTGHCFPTEWYAPTLTTSNVYQMTNSGKYPLVIGNCCKSGLFSQTESIGEAWVRARDKGAVAYIGSAPDTHWFEDLYWSVGAFPIIGNNAGYVPTVSETSLGAYDAPFTSLHMPVGAIQFIGNLSITQANLRGYQTQSNVRWYWEGYHTFGDPSTNIYQTQGRQNLVSHFPVIPLGGSTYNVQALPGSYVAISIDNVLIASGTVDESGSITLPVSIIQQPGTALIVVTKSQFIPYIQEVTIASLEGPYVVLDQFSINDADENNNQLAEYGETISLDIVVRNIGSLPAGSLTAWLTGGDDYIVQLDPDEQIFFPPLGVDEDNNQHAMLATFSIRINEQTPNNHFAEYILNVSDGFSRWRSKFQIKAQAPRFQISDKFTINDGIQGDGNGRLDPGETATIAFQISNEGGTTAYSPMVYLQSSSPHLTVHNSPQLGQPVAVGNAMYVIFNISANPGAPNGTQVPVSLRVVDGNNTESHHVITIGIVPEVTIGATNTPSNQYPFYNLYKANRSQAIYLAEEVGPGEKIITSIGYNILQVSNTYDHFPNFNIRIKHVGNDSFDNDFIDTSDASLVYESPAYQMPKNTGWHVWPIDDFVYDGVSNLLVEIVWGSLEGWTTNFFKVASTAYAHNSVAYGYSDNFSIAPFNGISFLRPNIRFTFIAIPVPIPQIVTFYARNDNNYPLNNIAITIDKVEQRTNQQGEARFELLPGEYVFTAHENGSAPFLTQSLFVGEAPVDIHFTHIRRFDVAFTVANGKEQLIDDASITIDSEKYEPGAYFIPGLRTGQYNYTVSKDGYFNVPGTLEILNSNIAIHVVLIKDDTGAEDLERTGKYIIYPIPASEQVTIELSETSGDTTIDLLSPHGKLIERRLIQGGGRNHVVVRFETGELPPGMYYIKLMSGSVVSIEKIILY